MRRFPRSIGDGFGERESMVESEKTASHNTPPLQVALVTGATAGIGWEFALELARRGEHHLFLTGRRSERLGALQREVLALWSEGAVGSSTPRIEVCQADLARLSEREELLRRFFAFSPSLDLLVNNAGFGTVGPFRDRPSSSQREMVQVNCEAPVHLTSALLPCLTPQGVVLNVASTVAFQPIPLMATYGASKSFLLSFSIALDNELRGSGPRVLCLCPGPTATEFHLVSGLPEKMDHLPAMSAREVVEFALSSVEGRTEVFIPGRLNRFLARLSKLLPLQLSARVAKLAIERSLP
jgi:short-subunit dehydrogenase